jgi:hypothetical protein
MSRKYEGVSGFKVAYFEKTGEYRPPKKHEYYLSGAIPRAWLAKADYDDPYHILRAVPAPPKTIVRNGFVYRLTGVIK